MTYLHPGHLGTPKFGTNAGGTEVWAWAPDAFGNGSPSGAVTVNFRMPGQYFDAESGLFYNWNRYYNPATGRYISSDPIGLDGGMNTFGYVRQSPVMWFDPWGLTEIGIGHNGGPPLEENIANKLPLLRLLSSAGAGLMILFDSTPLNANEAQDLQRAIQRANDQNSEPGGVCRAESALNSINLSKQLARESQMVERGISIAGTGTSIPLKQAERLAQQYGGNPADWVKMTSSTYRSSSGFQIETHWFENIQTGQRIQIKTNLIGQ